VVKSKSAKKMKRQKTNTRIRKRERIEASSGNVFADLGLPDADELLIKAQLAVSIAELIEQKGWNQTETARRIGVDQPKVSNLLRGRLSGFSSDRLFAILNKLGHSVEVRISAKERTPAKTQTHVTIC
jgi:predicted XRE-type DNA-binding protein